MSIHTGSEDEMLGGLVKDILSIDGLEKVDTTDEGMKKAMKKAEDEEKKWFEDLLKKYGLDTLTDEQKVKVRELVGDEDFMG
jgi:hypothetical protein